MGINRDKSMSSATGAEAINSEIRSEATLLKAGALQNAIFNSANFSSIATDAKGVIQIFNVGAERMLGYTAAEVMNQITPADISDPLEVIARAEELSVELGTPITPGFEALVFKASRGIEDIYELTYIRKDGSRFPAVVSVTALRDEQDAIIGYLLIGTDNTARKKAEEALLQAGALQSAIFNSANFSSIATDAKGVIQIFNVGAERMLGYTAAEVMNQITPADISDPQEVIARAGELSIELGTPITPGFEALVFKASRGIEDIYELTYIRKDGSRFPAVVSVTALRDDQDTIIGYLLIGTDNTARKQAEEALLKAGALQSAIFNSANFSSIATDAKGVIQIFNVGAERMLGYTAAEVMNQITPADISDPQEVIARAEELSVELGTPITPGFEALVFKASRGIEDIYELTYIRKDGSRFPAVVSVTALRDEQDAIIGYLLIGTDNTARKQIEAEQKQLSQRLRDHQFYTRSLFESNIDAIMTTDPAAIITDVNKQMEVLTGCTRDELIGAPFKNYFTNPDQAEKSIKQVLREKKVTNYELTARARDGKETVVSFNATTFYDRDRKLQGVFAAARDVTERKRLDQVLQEKNIELESARSVAEKTNLAKSDFLANMSHELRTPLNSVIGFSEVLQDQMFGPINEKQHEYVNNILTSGRHLLSLINDILDLSKVESGKMELELGPVLLRESLDSAMMMLREKALKGGIELHLELAPEADVRIEADQRKLKQILFNLLSNAVKFTPAAGTVDVRAVRDGDFIEITVADTGIGIRQEDVPKLFQAFTQLESVYTKGFEGTGLGLALTRQLVELHGGRIWMESEFGAGSRFSFTIPLAQTPDKKSSLTDWTPGTVNHRRNHDAS
jgi:PAS domain S-box-containing protein